MSSNQSEPGAPQPAPELNILLDGRYEGGNHEIFIELRIDEDGSGVISADLFRNFSFGGSQRLSDAHDALEEVRKRRQGRAKTITDPIVANIVRCNGIDAGRSYQRYSDGKFKPIDGDSCAAADLLEGLSGAVLRKTFDAHTAKHTEMLTKKYRKATPK